MGGAEVIRRAQTVLDSARNPEGGAHCHIAFESAGCQQHSVAGTNPYRRTVAAGDRTDHRAVGDDEVNEFGIAVQGCVGEFAQCGEEPAD